MGVRIYLTGQVSVRAGEVLLTESELVGRQGRLAFAYLVTERLRAVSRDELAEALWEEAAPRAWEIDLRAIVSRLRAALGRIGLDGTNLLASSMGCYQFHLPSEGWVDVEAAADGIHRAEALLKNGRPREACGWALVARMVARRPFLAGQAESWVGRKQAQLRAMRVRALDALAEIWTVTGDPLLAVRDAEEAIELELYREISYQHLMRAHYAAGNRGEAVRAYQRCLESLRRDLDVDPSPATDALYREISEGKTPTTTLQRGPSNVAG